MTLADLKKSISKMTDEELLEIIHASRNAREVPTAKPAKKKKEVAEPELDLSTMTQEELLALLDSLEDDED